MRLTTVTAVRERTYELEGTALKLATEKVLEKKETKKYSDE